MNHQILLWIALAMIAAGVVALNVWDRRRRKPMSVGQRKLGDDRVSSDLSQW
jgi:hypothetical protein